MTGRPSQAALLRVAGLTKSFQGIQAVKDFSFTVAQGGITALIGPNGAGKTTVFNLLTGFLVPDAGAIDFRGTSLVALAPHRIARLGLARTFQTIRLFPKMTVLENVLLAMPDQNERLDHALAMTPAMRRAEDSCRREALQWLRLVDLHGKANEEAGNLSFGQQKLLEIAKALATKPALLLLDEPAAGVNLTMLARIGGLIRDLRAQGITILFIEHNMDFVMTLADTVVVLDYGEGIAIGTPSEVRSSPRVIEAYLGGGVSA